MAIPNTLADLTYAVAVELKTVREGVITTGASQTIFSDTLRTEGPDYWNGGPFWLLYQSPGTAPTGEWSVVTDFANGQATITPGTTVNMAVGARYAMGRRRYPQDILIQAVNEAYRDLGMIPASDEATLVTAEDTTQYTLPADAVVDLREVWLETDTDLPASHGWVKLDKGYWRQELGTLYIPQLPTDDAYAVKVVYVGQAPTLVDYDDTLSPYIHPKRIVYKAAANCLLWRAERVSSTSIANAINQRVNFLLDMDQKAKYEHPIIAPPKANKILSVQFTGGPDMELNTKPGIVNLS